MQIVAGKRELSIGHEIPELEFDIGDKAFIIDIMTSRVYSDPMHTICQEIMSNGRDAHREIGKDDTPIEVHLPTSFDPYFKVRDFGPGISPDRMKNVFTLYGRSTKRADNTQTGGFGIGAKTPLAYVDAFTCVTITPDKVFTDANGVVHNDVLVKRTYSIFRNQARIPTLGLLEAEITDEPQGTCIIVAIKPNDFNRFIAWTKYVGNYWDVRPIIKGCSDFEFDDMKVIFEGDGWCILDRNSMGYNNSYPLAIVDGIPYPLNQDSIKIEDDKDCNRMFSYPLRLFFKTGEVHLTANREELDYNMTDCDMLARKIREAVAGLRAQMQENVSKAENLYQANVMWKKEREGYARIIEEVKWNDLPVRCDPIILNRMGISVWWFSLEYSYHTGTMQMKRVNTSNSCIEFDEKSILCIDDTGDNYPSRARARTLLANNPGIERIQVIVYPTEPTKHATAVKDANDAHHIDLMGATMLSTVEKARTPRTGEYKKRPPIKVRKFNGCTSKRSAWDEVDADFETDGGFYVITDRFTVISARDGRNWSLHDLYSIHNQLGITIYALTQNQLNKWKEKGNELNSDWVPLEVAIEEKYEATITDVELMNKYHQTDSSNSLMTNKYYNISEKLTKKQVLSLPENNTFRKYYFASENYITKTNNSDIVNTVTMLCRLLGKERPVQTGVDNMTILKNEFEQRYPLLVSAGYSIYQVSPEHVLWYLISAEEEYAAKTAATVGSAAKIEAETDLKGIEDEV